MFGWASIRTLSWVQLDLLLLWFFLQLSSDEFINGTRLIRQLSIRLKYIICISFSVSLKRVLCALHSFNLFLTKNIQLFYPFLVWLRFIGFKWFMHPVVRWFVNSLVDLRKVDPLKIWFYISSKAWKFCF